MALSYGELSSITQTYFVPRLIDNIFASNALLQRMRKKNYEKMDGGTKIIIPLLYATTTAAGRYSGAQALDTTPNDQITAAEFDWKQYYANITVTRIDELKNSGKSQIVNFVKAKVQAAERTLANLLGTDLFGDGTTANSFYGLAAICAGTGSTYGGISKTTYSWWRGQADSTTTALTVGNIRGMIGDCSIDSDGPTVAVTTQNVFDNVYSLLQPQQRFQDSDTAKAGFKNILWEGIPMIIDSHVAAGDLYFLNENYISMIVHKDEDFRFEPFIKPTNQNISTAKIYWTGALTCSNCRLQGWFSAIA
jgi:hypothetical protein